jgi:hypothetical protein
MKKYGALIVVALVAAVATYATTATSAPNAGPTPQSLQRQINTLKSQVAKLQKTQKSQTTAINDAGNLAALSLVFSACSTAVTADAVQGTWQIVDQIAAATQAGKVYFGPQAAVSDAIQGLTAPACQALRVLRSQTLPPTAAQFSALIGILSSSQLQGYRPQHG